MPPPMPPTGLAEEGSPRSRSRTPAQRGAAAGVAGQGESSNDAARGPPLGPTAGEDSWGSWHQHGRERSPGREQLADRPATDDWRGGHGGGSWRAGGAGGAGGYRDWRQDRRSWSGHGKDDGSSQESGDEDDEDSDAGQRNRWSGGWDRKRGGFQQKWLSRMVPRKKLKREGPPSEFFCNVCNKDLKRRERYDQHMAEDHVPCTEPGCNFSGPEHVMAVHRLKHTKAADGKSVVDSPEELKAWREARRASFPTKGNLDKKRETDVRRQQLGVLEDDKPKPGMLEKLIRRTHLMESSSNKGGWGWDGGKGYGKGKGKWGKGKDKGKWDKGKGKGKKGKGKGKGKSKGWYSWDWQGGGDWHGSGDVDAPPPSGDRWAQSLEHFLAPTQVSVPLPSMVANCAPLEAPFGSDFLPPPPVAQRYTRGVCRYFEKGFCFHGDRCQYEHSGPAAALGASAAGSMQEGGSAAAAQRRLALAASPAAAAEAASATWWALPSTLANRCCPGEEPPPRPRPALGRDRPTYVRPSLFVSSRERRDGLLRRLLKPEVDGFYSTILQCVRYIVDTDFLRVERALRPIPGAPAAAAAPAGAPDVAAVGGGPPAPPALATEDLDLADEAELEAMDW